MTSTQSKPKLPGIYLAGKIKKNCWRHRIVDGLRDHRFYSGPLMNDTFVYQGPFFVGCDHGCSHGDSTHGAMPEDGWNTCTGADYLGRFNFRQLEVVNRCLNGIVKSDLVFAFIDSTDCFGTLFELGFARAHGIPTFVAFAAGVASADTNDMWFASSQSLVVHYDTAEQDLPELLDSIIRSYE